jgi:2-amino-4-hydroxy-6-hydroxymethyldihydropteridine diphosphokinase
VNLVSAPVIAAIGLGANLGDAAGALAHASAAIAQLPQSEPLSFSGIYCSAPVESSGPDYLNAVQLIRTSLPALTLLKNLLAIERQHGRERPYKNAPRTLDLDLLLYGEQAITTPTLSVPHPRMHLRAFVLLPLLEVWPDAVISGIGPAADQLPRVADQSISRAA